MRLLPHQVLKKLAEYARNRAQYELAALNAQRQQLYTQRDTLLTHIKQVQQQREQAIRISVQAGTLQMFEETISEQKQQISILEDKMEYLHGQEQELLKRWLEQDRRSKALTRVDEKFVHQAASALDRHQQRIDDDRAASRLNSNTSNSLVAGA